MPRCYGLPAGECPLKKNDVTVTLRQGDMMLCQSCCDTRFGGNKEEDKNTRENNTNNTDDNEETNEVNIVNPLLAYILFSLHSGTVENVRNAVIDHFPLDIIINAKNILWDSCDRKLIGEKIKRKGSTIRTENEANVTDILSALQKLDRSDKLPNVLIDHKNLSMIPRSHPEELTNIFLVDRLNRFEAKLGSVQELLDRTVAENINMKDRLDNITSYASVLKRVEPVERQKVNSPVAAVLTADRASRSSSSDEEPPHQVTPEGSPSQQVRDQPFPRYPQTGRGTENAGHNNVQIDKNDNNGEQRNVTDRRYEEPTHRPPGFRGRGGQRGRRHRGDQCDLLQSNLVRAISNLSLNSYDSVGSTSRGRYRNDDFETPRHFQKKHRQEERRRIKVITGNTKPGNGRFRGAPEPSRDIFVYRTHADTVVSDISDLIKSNGFHVREVNCISNPSARYKSFKLSVPASQLDSVLTDTFPWPEGVCVRRFTNRRRREQNDANDW